MGIVIGILTGILVLVCVLLVLIILMQKSKQEAGLGAAFGGAATEQIFGAGTTSVLTKATIWGTALFFVLTLALAIYYSHTHHPGSKSKVLGEVAATNEVPALAAAPGATNEAVEAAEPKVETSSATNAPAAAAPEESKTAE